jgi:hypothetical protein
MSSPGSGRRTHFLRCALIGLAVLEPDESSEWDEMVAFHWGFDSLMEAESVAEALTVLGQRPELVLLRVSNYDDPTPSIVFRPRDAPH